MYYFALSLVPKLNRLLPRNHTRAQIQRMTCMADLDVEDEGQRQHATAAHIMFPSRGSQHPQSSGCQPIRPTPTYHEEQTHRTHNHLGVSLFAPHPPTMRNKPIAPTIIWVSAYSPHTHLPWGTNPSPTSHLPQCPPCLSHIPLMCTINCSIAFMCLADAFIQSDFRLYLYCQYVCSLGTEPTTFALLTQCSTTEPQEHRNYSLPLPSLWKV